MAQASTGCSPQKRVLHQPWGWSESAAFHLPACASGGPSAPLSSFSLLGVPASQL